VSGKQSENIRLLDLDTSIQKNKRAVIFSNGASKAALKILFFDEP